MTAPGGYDQALMTKHDQGPGPSNGRIKDSEPRTKDTANTSRALHQCEKRASRWKSTLPPHVGNTGMRPLPICERRSCGPRRRTRALVTRPCSERTSAFEKVTRASSQQGNISTMCPRATCRHILTTQPSLPATAQEFAVVSQMLGPSGSSTVRLTPFTGDCEKRGRARDGLTSACAESLKPYLDRLDRWVVRPRWWASTSRTSYRM